MSPEIWVVTPMRLTCVPAHLTFAHRGQASDPRKRWGEYSAVFLKPFCPLPVQRKFGITYLSVAWNHYGAHVWPIGTHGPPPP